MSRAMILGLIVSSCSVAISAHAQSVIEGYVFDASGKPLQTAQILISSDDPGYIPIGGLVFTDSNGFFSIESPDFYDGLVLKISARCLVLDRNFQAKYHTTGTTRSQVVREGVMNRNFYIQYAPKKKEVLRCQTRVTLP